MSETSDKKILANIIGNRVKSARMLSGHTRKSFSGVSGISTMTLRSWEEPFANRSGLTNKGAKRLIAALEACGIHCTTDWLLHGKGPGPTLLTSTIAASTEATEPVTWGEEESILRDIESFKTNNPDPIVAIVGDSAMLPRFSLGDYVAGSRVYGDEIRQLVGSDCIIEYAGETLIRRISNVTADNQYTLITLHHDPTVINATIAQATLDSAAEIVWHRWRKRIKNIRV